MRFNCTLSALAITASLAAFMSATSASAQPAADSNSQPPIQVMGTPSNRTDATPAEAPEAKPVPHYNRNPRNREDHENSFEFLLNPVGFSTVGASTRSLSAGFYIEPSTVLVAEIGLLRSYGADWENDLKATTFSVSVKQFTGHSFYVRGGLNYEQVTVDNNSSDFGDNSRTTDVFAASIGIGNQWQIHHFVIGCQWVDTIFPISQRDSSQQGEISNYYATNPQFEFLRGSVGFAF